MEVIQDIDFRILDWIQAHFRGAFLDWLMPKITLFGEIGLFWIFLAVLFLCTKKLRRCGLMLSAGLICSLLIGNLFLKNIVGRDRPCWIRPLENMLIAVPKDYSFPSGHTLVCFIGAVTLFQYDRRMGIPALVIAIAVAFSRMYLYVHFPSDVLAGAVLGIAIGLIVGKVSAAIERRRRRGGCDAENAGGCQE